MEGQKPTQAVKSDKDKNVKVDLVKAMNDKLKAKEILK